MFSNRGFSKATNMQHRHLAISRSAATAGSSVPLLSQRQICLWEQPRQGRNRLLHVLPHRRHSCVLATCRHCGAACAARAADVPLPPVRGKKPGASLHRRPPPRQAPPCRLPLYGVCASLTHPPTHRTIRATSLTPSSASQHAACASSSASRASASGSAAYSRTERPSAAASGSSRPAGQLVVATTITLPVLLLPVPLLPVPQLLLLVTPALMEPDDAASWSSPTSSSGGAGGGTAVHAHAAGMGAASQGRRVVGQQAGRYVPASRAGLTPGGIHASTS